MGEGGDDREETPPKQGQNRQVCSFSSLLFFPSFLWNLSFIAIEAPQAVHFLTPFSSRLRLSKLARKRVNMFQQTLRALTLSYPLRFNLAISLTCNESCVGIVYNI